MGKALLITTDNEIKEVEIDFDNDEENKVNKQIREYIGNDCEYYEAIPSYFLNHTYNLTAYPTRHRIGVCLLIDEEGKLRNLNENLTATFLYTSYEPIAGNALLVAVGYNKNDDIDYVSFPKKFLPFFKNVLDKIATSIKKNIEKFSKED